jgi:hypothetical protein
MSLDDGPGFWDTPEIIDPFNFPFASKDLTDLRQTEAGKELP